MLAANVRTEGAWQSTHLPSFGFVQAALVWAMCDTQQLAAHQSQRLSRSL